MGLFSSFKRRRRSYGHKKDTSSSSSSDLHPVSFNSLLALSPQEIKKLQTFVTEFGNLDSATKEYSLGSIIRDISQRRLNKKEDESTDTKPKSVEMSDSEEELSDFITDSHQRVVEPGDAMWVGDVFTKSWAMFAGDRSYIICEKPKCWVTKMKMQDEDHFGRLEVTSDKTEVPSPRDRLQEAETWVGKEFSKGNTVFPDFLAWTYSRQRYLMAVMNGFHMNVGEVRHKMEEQRPQYIVAKPDEPDLTGKTLEAKDKQTGLWYKVKVIRHKNEVKVRAIGEQRFTGFIPVSELKPDQPRNDSSIVGRIFEAKDYQTKKWNPVIVSDHRKNQVKVFWMRRKQESRGFIPLSSLRPFMPEYVPNLVGMSCEVDNNGTRCRVMVTQHSNKVEVRWITRENESDELIPTRKLKSHIPWCQEGQKVMARFRPNRPTLSEAAVLNCEGGFVHLQYEDGRKKKILEKYAFEF